MKKDTVTKAEKKYIYIRVMTPDNRCPFIIISIRKNRTTRYMLLIMVVCLLEMSQMVSGTIFIKTTKKKYD